MPIHWHRRDLCPADNVGLANAAADARASDANDGALLPLFVIDDALLAHAGPPRVAFLLDALDSLRSWYRERDSDLLLVHGDPREVVPEIATEHGIDLVTWNRDYSAAARDRDAAVRRALADRRPRRAS